ncbi:YbaB/EbfC family nucleoid-associated protein [Nocardioides sp. BP30]|uniref:YbaB/EbfC family nucleoid-associated protein n=1 Tax=Nocardioides sp. BP30 TaxID=3036374 RepID=UPI002468ED64|nr:YbaB/EbfC family nucleoid-associated protein [Nocardioides sp. BP30]WGL53253.1 YbaB/EbfC family nucleoid-associated protein [Nocardioides sp. BP30]
MSHLTPEDVHRRIDQDVAAAQERAALATRFRQTADQLRGTATVDGVTATVDASGALTELTLPDRLEHRRSTVLAAQVLRATRAAYADVTAKVQQAAGEAFGADSPVTARVRGELDRRAEVLASSTPPPPDNVLR